MSPVTERIVKADTTSLLQQAHFLHPTQVVQRVAATPSSGPAGKALYLTTVLRCINFHTIVLVTGTGLQARVEQKTQKLISVTNFTTIFHKVMRSRPVRI